MLAAPTAALAEEQFAASVDSLAAGGDRQALMELLREEHAVYHGRGTAAVSRMRGWILLALARAGLSPDSLPFVLEELESGTDPYLVAAAARALRSYPEPSPDFAPLLVAALSNIRYCDEFVSLDAYGEYVVGGRGVSAVTELLATLKWLGPNARDVLPRLHDLRRPPGGLPSRHGPDLDRTITAIAEDTGDCCALGLDLRAPLPWSGRGPEPPCGVVLEDQDGAHVTFAEFFQGAPTIVVFFYTRCDNPMKCSLTVAKLARVQKLLQAGGYGGRIRTAAITYDPAFDSPARLRVYGGDRGVVFDQDHRIFRVVEGFDRLSNYFALGVNFVESLVNRHRLEVFLLDSRGRIAATFQRMQWDESEVVSRAADLLAGQRRRRLAPGMFASVAVAFFPKCPVCWGAWLSAIGIAGVPYLPALQPLLVALMLINAASVWLRSRGAGRLWPAYLVCAGALLILAANAIGAGGWASGSGVVLTIAGSVWSTLGNRTGSFAFRRPFSSGSRS